VINSVTLWGANGCLRVTLAPCGRHSCDPRKLEIQFFLAREATRVVVVVATSSSTGSRRHRPSLQSKMVSRFGSHDL